MLCVSAKPVFPKQTYLFGNLENSLLMRQICRSNWGRCVLPTWYVPENLESFSVQRCFGASVWACCLSVCQQNLCFILPQFLYQFFCGYSQQVSMSWWPFEVQTWCGHEKESVPRLHISLFFWIPDSFPQTPPPLVPLGCVSPIYLCMNLYYTLR